MKKITIYLLAIVILVFPLLVNSQASPIVSSNFFKRVSNTIFFNNSNFKLGDITNPILDGRFTSLSVGSLTASSAEIGFFTSGCLEIRGLATSTICGDGSDSTIGADLVVTGGINSLIYTSGSNLGIGTTTPSALLTVGENYLRVQSDGNIIFGDDSTSRIAQASSTLWMMGVPLAVSNIITEPDLGLHTVYNQPLTSGGLATSTPVGALFSISSEPVLLIYGESNWLGSVQNRRVGIATTTPSYTLDVAGDIRGTNYYSTDGTIGWTGTCSSASSTVVKNGLVTACE